MRFCILPLALTRKCGYCYLLLVVREKTNPCHLSFTALTVESTASSNLAAGRPCGQFLPMVGPTKNIQGPNFLDVPLSMLKTLPLFD